MMDAMLFAVVIMVASAFLVHFLVQDTPGSYVTADILDSVMSSEVRMSDLVPEGDGSMVRVSDLAALMVMEGGGPAGDFITEAMDALCSGRPWTLELSFGEGSMVLGGGGPGMTEGARAEYPVTTGGVLFAEIRIQPS